MIEKDYAYVGRQGVVHLVDDLETAQKGTRDGKIVEVGRGIFEPSGGYPRINGKRVFADVEEKTIHIGGSGNNNKGKRIALVELPAELQGVLLELGYSGE